MCVCSPENQTCPGLHQADRAREMILSHFSDPTWKAAPSAGNSAQEGPLPAGVSPGEGHEDD